MPPPASVPVATPEQPSARALPRASTWRRLGAWGGLSAFYLAAAVALTWPLVEVWTTHLVAPFRYENMVLDIWILRWDLHALTTAPARLFDANAFHPAPQSLAFSEHLLGLVPFYGAAWVLTKNPVLSLNVVILASFVLSGLTMHLLVWSWRRNHLAALVAGLAFAFAPWRLVGSGWPHGLWVPYFPLIVLGLDRVGREGRRRDAWLTGSCITLQMLTSYYLAYMTLLIAGGWMLADLAVRGFRGRRRELRGFVVALAVPAAVLVPVSLPYLVQRSAGVVSWTWLTEFQKLVGGVTDLGMIEAFSGWVTAALALLYVSSRWWSAAAPSTDGRTRGTAFGLILVASLLIARGPRGIAGGWISLYSWAAALVPGFGMVRVPRRFGIVLSFVLAVLAGLGVAELSRALARRGRWVVRTAGGLAAASVLAYSATALALYPFPAKAQLVPVGFGISPAYPWLAAHGEGGPLLELQDGAGPGSEDNLTWRGDTLAMYHSTLHWLPLLNGYSGYTPPSYVWLTEQVRHLRKQGTVLTLARCTGLRWVLVHGPRPDLRLEWDRVPGLRLVKTFPAVYGTEDWLYEVEDDACGVCPVEDETIRTYPFERFIPQEWGTREPE